MEYHELESLLIEKGVSKEYLKMIQKETPKKRSLLSDFNFNIYYEDNENEKEQNVPVHKIKMLSREGLPNDSWFDLSINAKYNTSNIDLSRIDEALTYLINSSSLSSYHQSLITDIQPVPFEYYDEHDIYTVGHNGNHRTILAKLTNAPYIRGVVKTYNFNANKYKAYTQIKNAIKEFDSVLDQLGFYPDDDDELIYYKNKAIIGAIGYFEHYFTFKNYRRNEGFYSLFSNTVHKERFINRLKEITPILYELNAIKTKYQQIYNSLKKFKRFNLNNWIFLLYHKTKCLTTRLEEEKLHKLAFTMCLRDFHLEDWAENKAHVSPYYL